MARFETGERNIEPDLGHEEDGRGQGVQGAFPGVTCTDVAERSAGWKML